MRLISGMVFSGRYERDDYMPVYSTSVRLVYIYMIVLYTSAYSEVRREGKPTAKSAHARTHRLTNFPHEVR